MGLWIFAIAVGIIAGLGFAGWLAMNGAMRESEGRILIALDLMLMVVMGWIMSQMIAFQASGALQVLGQ